jgi:hypothetical protein
MSGLRKTEPTAGAAPSRRKTRGVSGNIEKRAAFAWVWSWKVWSTTKPRRAISSAGFIRSPNLIVPKELTALAQVAGLPGTPTLRPELTALLNTMGVPSASWKTCSSNVGSDGAASRPSMVFTSPEPAS